MPLVKKIGRVALVFLGAFAVLAVIAIATAKIVDAALPGDKLYDFKLFKEELMGKFIYDKNKKLEFHLARLDERLKEIILITGRILAEAGKTSERPTTKKTALVLAETDEEVDFQLSPKLSFEEMLTRSDQIVAQIETASQTVKRLQQEARAARDVIKLACINEKLLQINTARRIGLDRQTRLKSAVNQNNQELAMHEFITLVVVQQQVDQLTAEATQCIGEEGAFIGQTEIVRTVNPDISDDEPKPPSEILPSVRVDEVNIKALDLAWQKYIEIVGSLPEYLAAQQGLEVIVSFLNALTNQQNSINNLAPLTLPQTIKNIDEALDSIENISEGAFEQAQKIDSSKAVEVRRVLIGKEAETLVDYLSDDCENGFKIRGVCIKGATNRNGVYISIYGNLIDGLTNERINANPWIQNEDYLESVISETVDRLKGNYESDINKYQDQVYKSPNSNEEQTKFASQMFNHWLAFSELPVSSHVSELVAIAKINEEAAVQNIANRDPVTAAGINMMLMDREIRIITDSTNQPLRVTLPEILEDYNDKLIAVQVLFTSSDGTISPKVVLANEELIRRGVLHGVILTIIKDTETDQNQTVISGTISNLSSNVKKSVSTIKKADPDLYESKVAYYQPLSQGLSQGLMQGLSQGLQAGIQQGIQSGVQQGIQAGLQSQLQAGLQAGMQAGLQAGMQAGIQAGLQAGLQQGIYQKFYQSFLEELALPPNNSWLGESDFGGASDYSGGESFGGDDFAGGSDFGGGDDFFGGDGFGGGDDFGGTYSIIVPTGLIQKVPQGLAPLGEEPTPTSAFQAPSAPPFSPAPTSASSPAPTNPPSTPPPPPDPATVCVQNGCTWTGSTCQCP